MKTITPLPIQLGRNGDSLAIWLDNPASKNTVSSSNQVQTWKDYSGKGNDVTQATVSKRPLNNVKTKNGITGLTFDGVNDELRAATRIIDTPTDNMTLFVVCDMDGSSTSNVGVASQWGGVGSRDFALYSSTQLKYAAGFGPANFNFSEVPQEQPSLLMLQYNAALGVNNSLFNIDGVNITISASTPRWNWGCFYSWRNTTWFWIWSLHNIRSYWI